VDADGNATEWDEESLEGEDPKESDADEDDEPTQPFGDAR
jgi:hypothetical protein